MLRTFRGVVEGEILDEPRGSEGFGYDPLFYYPPYKKSFGEVSVEEKMAVSHRGRALTAMFRFVSDSPLARRGAGIP
jgi:XTP/dITP diphosphohydrolase